MRNQSAYTEMSPVEFLDLYNRRIVADGAADLNEPIIADFRANGGPTGLFTGAPILLLTTTGAKTGQPRTAPVVYTRDGDRYVVLASRAGAPVHPAWYHNLVATPRATLELGHEALSVGCSFPEGQERERLATQHLAALPDPLRGLMQGYQQQTTRQFPVVVLCPVASHEARVWSLGPATSPDPSSDRRSADHATRAGHRRSSDVWPATRPRGRAPGERAARTRVGAGRP